MLIYNKILFFVLFFVSMNTGFAQNPNNAYKAKKAPLIDGNSNDECWQKAKWFNIDKVWIPYGTKIDSADFSGRYKISWDNDYLYLFVEITDNVFKNEHPNILEDYWWGDVVELFIDEDRSKGLHRCSYQAFAYHVCPNGKVVDRNAECVAAFVDDHIKVKVDTIGLHTYNWELAVKIYSDKYSPENPEKSRVCLNNDKLMGFSIAYCDNDETIKGAKNNRKSFLGSMEMNSVNFDDNCKTADYFGALLLVE
jgi:hypothetical protein